MEKKYRAKDGKLMRDFESLKDLYAVGDFSNASVTLLLS